MCFGQKKFPLSLHLVYQAVCDVKSVYQVKCEQIEIERKGVVFLVRILLKLGEIENFILNPRY